MKSAVFAHMRIRTKLLIAFLVVSVIPFSVIGMTALLSSNSALSRLAFGQLEGLREVKKAQISTFLMERRKNMDVLAETVANFQQAAFGKLQSVQETKKAQVEAYFHNAANEIAVIANNDTVRTALDRFSLVVLPDGGINDSMYQFFKNDYDSSLQEFKEGFGYDDLLLISKDGVIVYSTNEDPDLAQNVLDSPFQQTSIRNCFQDGLQEVVIRDFAPYPPAENEYIACIGAPIMGKSALLGAVVLKVTKEPINTIVQRREGMGKTGETYLAGSHDGAFSYRSDRVATAENIGNPVSGEHLERALSGASGSMVKIGHAGDLELASYDPLEVAGVDWVMSTVVSLEEVITPRLEGEQEDYFSRFISQYGYADLYLIHPKGTIFYSVKQLDEYGTNILSGEYASSGLGHLTQKVLEKKSFGFADFQAYPPDNDEPAAFMALPLLSGEQVALIVAVRLPIDAINTVMQERSGMGETGDTYLVGTDKLMRSDSFLAPDTHSVKNSFANPEQAQIDTEASRNALSGATGRSFLKDYQGNRVLSAYTPVKIWDTTYALIAEMSEAEALAAVTQVKAMIGVVAFIFLATIVGMSLLFAKNIAAPIQEVVSTANAIARGDFSKELTLRRRDEIGQLVDAFRMMQQAIEKQLQEVRGLLFAVQRGQLDQRGDADAFQGSWKDLVIGINSVIEAFMAPFNVTAEYIDRVSRGEIPQKITEDYQGDFKEIQLHLNGLIDGMDEITQVAEAIAGGNLSIEVASRSSHDRLMMALDRMVRRISAIATEIRTMIQSVEDGNLEIRGNADAFEGGWHALIKRMNSLVGVLSSAVADNAAMNQEMELARKIQMAILPKDIEHDDLEIKAIMLPADEVGGDYYDMLYGHSEELWVGIGDVSGHGVTPGLIMMMAQTIKTTIATHLQATPREILNMTNDILYRNVHERLGENHLMTFLSLKYLGGGHFQYAEAAHDSPLIYRQRTHSCERVQTKGVWLNILPDISHITEDATFTLDVGDVLILYTDGITEAWSPEREQLDIKGFEEIVLRHADKTTGAMRDAIMEEVLEWCDHKRADDITLMLIRRKA